MKRASRLILLLIAAAIGAGCGDDAPDLAKPFTVQRDIYHLDLRMHHLSLESSITGRAYQIDLSYLADNADLRDMPVIYLTDGQWRRMDHKYIHYLTAKKMIPPVLVAGIGYADGTDAGTLRTYDFYVMPDRFLRMIKEEAIPLVERKFPADPKQRYLFGTSLGGRFAAYACIQDALENDATFCGYIGSSPYLESSGLAELARRLTADKHKMDKGLYLAYGSLEDKSDFQTPNNELSRLLDRGHTGLTFYHHVYPGADHASNTRLTLIDGLRLLLGTEEARGIGAVDLEYPAFTYDFSTTAQFYDWNTEFRTQNKFETDPARSADGKPGSYAIEADFTKYDTLTFSTSSVYFEGFADREVRFGLYVPADLAKLGYTLRFVLYTTFDPEYWLTDISEEEFALSKSGWNTFKYKWRGRVVTGNQDCVRGFGIAIAGKSAPAWRGTLYVDDVGW